MAATRTSTTIGMLEWCRQLAGVPTVLIALAEAAAAFSLFFTFLEGWRRD